MAKLILKSPYLKCGGKEKVSGYLRYIATRERVQRIADDRPATQKQEQLITKLLRDFPDAKELLEYETWEATHTKRAASAFISTALECNWSAVSRSDVYMKYIATRPRSERLGTHGLFGDSDDVDLDKAALELDSYWVQYGGADPVEKLNQYKGRCPLLHVKDMSADASRTFTEVGRGIMDWGAILPAAAKAGVHWFIVEQDTCPGDSLESARISADYMRSL